MTSQTVTPFAPPVWGNRRAVAVRAPAPRLTPPPRALRPAVAVRPLELRVGGAGGVAAAVVGIALAAGFALLWAFLLLGVVAPAGTLG